jgi:hypothetical protein
MFFPMAKMTGNSPVIKPGKKMNITKKREFRPHSMKGAHVEPPIIAIAGHLPTQTNM